MALADTVPPYPLDQCAAFWHGYADVLGDDGQRELADQFRDASAELIGAAEADALIAEKRVWIVDLMNAYIHHQDDQSRDLFRRLVTGCGRMAADLPHLRPEARP